MIYDVIVALESTQSRKEKEQILRDNDSDFLRRVLDSALNPYVNYYIKQIPSVERVNTNLSLMQAMDDLLEELSERRITGNAARNKVTDILSSMSVNDAEILSRILQKDLKCGVAASTLNKVFGKGFIPTHPCMLAEKQDEKTVENIVFPAVVQEKMDGMRINAIVRNRQVQFYSRNGKIVDCGHDNLNRAVVRAAEALNLGEYQDVVFDGELLVCNLVDNTFEDRKTSNGIANKAIRGTITEEEKKKFFFVCWDVIPYDDFLKGKHTVEYGKRFGEMYRDFGNIDWSDMKPDMGLIQTMMVHDWDEINAVAEKIIAEGGEGVVVKNIDSPWEDKRSKNQVKVKQCVDGDFVVTDWIEGTGKCEGKLGSLSCQTSDGKVCFNVGSGFTDEQRESIDRDIIGKIVTVKYNERIKDKNSDTESLFLPVFVEIRDDKDVANTIGELV